MLIFGNDDNDDNLDLDFDGNKSAPATPPNSSLPTRPGARSPFGSNADQVENLVPDKKPGAPSRPVPSSPFGQSVPANKPRLPQNPMSEAQRAPVARENSDMQKPPRPIAKPVEEAVSQPVTPPATPALSSYLPPAKKVEPVAAPAPQPVYVEPDEQPERLSESELFIRTMKEHADERAAIAKREEAAARAVTPIANTVAPTTANSSVPAPVSIDTLAEGNNNKKKKQGFFSPPPKKDKPAKASKPPRESKYAGERKKVLYIRLIAGSVAAVIAIAGFQAIFLPDTGPTKTQVQAAAKEAVNYTGFPTASGEQFAMDFARAYFNFDSSDKNREDSLERFAAPDLVKLIDITPLTTAEAEAVKKVDQSATVVSSQSITYGPYVVANKNLTDKIAVFTVKVGLSSGTVVYLDVPVKYDPANYSMTLAGPPSFTKPIQNVGAAKPNEYTVTFEGGSDGKIVESFQSDLEAYLSAWALSDSTIINRYILDKATDNAKKGLQGSVKFSKILELKIEPLDEKNPVTTTSRRVEVNVLWEDTKTGLRYPQQYRMSIGKNPDNKWAIANIENFAVLNK